MEKYNDDFLIIKQLLPYYVKKGHEQIGICTLESYISNSDIYDENRYDAMIELKNLQYSTNNMNNYIYLIMKLIIEYDYYNEDDFNNLKKNYPEWDNIKKDIIQVYEYTNTRHLYDFYIYNNMINEFMDEIFDNPDLSLINEYSHILINKSPKRLREAYEGMIYDLLKVAKRSKYRKVAKILSHMKELPNCSHDVKRIINDLKNKYPQRKALIDELDKI